MMIDRDTLASLVVEVRWKGGEADHRETYFAQRVNFWRDLLSERLTDVIRVFLSKNSMTISWRK